jgi:hypothetical protein
MNNTIFYLISHAGSARRDVARAIDTAVRARIIDSQDIYAPIFNLVEPTAIANMPEGVWTQVDVVRSAVLATIETLSPRERNFIFTHAGLDIPADIGVYRTVRATAVKRGARFQPARLIDGDSRRPLLTFDEPHAIDININTIAPEDAAAGIVDAASR